MDIARPILAAVNYVASAILAWITLIQIVGFLFFATALSVDILLPLPSLIGVAVGIAHGVLLANLDQAGARVRAVIVTAGLANAVLLLAVTAYSMSKQYYSGADIHAAWACSAVVYGATSIFVWSQPQARQPNVCSKCGYDTTGLATCPECGTSRKTD